MVCKTWYLTCQWLLLPSFSDIPSVARRKKKKTRNYPSFDDNMKIWICWNVAIKWTVKEAVAKSNICSISIQNALTGRSYHLINHKTTIKLWNVQRQSWGSVLRLTVEVQQCLQLIWICLSMYDHISQWIRIYVYNVFYGSIVNQINPISSY